MKAFQQLISKLWYILLCVCLVSCSEKDDIVIPDPDPEPVPVEKDYELADNVIELEGDLLKHVSSLKGDTLVYNSNTPDDALPKVGEIVIVTQPTDVFPYGFLGKVTKVSKDGNVLVITEAASLDEAFTYLDVEGTFELEPADVQSKGMANEKFTFGDKFECELGDFVKGELEINVKVILNIKLLVDKRNNKNIRTGYIDIEQENKTKIDAYFTCKTLEQEGDETKPLGKGFKVWRIAAGPIIIVPTIQPYIKSVFEGTMDIGWGLETWSGSKYRMNYDGKGWSLPETISKDEREWDFNVGPNVEMAGNAFIGGGVALEFRFYDNENIKVALNSQLGVEASGEVGVNMNDLVKGNDEEFYNQLEDSNIALALKGGVGLEASAKIFFIKAKWEHPLAEKTFVESKSYVFPSFSNHSLSYANGGISASTNLGRNLLWKQDVGLALYKGDECLEVSEPVEYKYENDFKERNPLEGIFEEIPEEKKDEYSVWSYTKWGDLYIKCKQLIPRKKIKRFKMSELGEEFDDWSFYYKNDSISSIVRMDGDYRNVWTFEYSEDGYLNVKSSYTWEHSDYSIKLNDNGYAVSCKQTYHGDGTWITNWKFEYNEEGQLVHVSNSQNESWSISYQDSNAVSVSGSDSANISYGNLEGRGYWILYDWMCGIDFDDHLEIFGLLGLLGEPSKNLPSTSSGEDYPLYYNWTVDNHGYPEKLSVDGVEMDFSWE